MMVRLMLEFQVQENGNSIQAELDKALKMTKERHIPVSGSGPYRLWVHANSPVVHIRAIRSYRS